MLAFQSGHSPWSSEPDAGGPALHGALTLGEIFFSCWFILRSSSHNEIMLTSLLDEEESLKDQKPKAQRVLKRAQKSVFSVCFLSYLIALIL